jgi:hypothetical protein
MPKEDFRREVEKEQTGKEEEPSELKPRLRLHPKLYEQLWREVLQRDGWRCQSCGNLKNRKFITRDFPANPGMILSRT